MKLWLGALAVIALDHLLAWNGRRWALALKDARHGDLPPLWEVRTWRLGFYKRVALADLYPRESRILPWHLKHGGVDP